MRECKFDNCNQCVHSNNADCDNPKFEKHMEEEERKKVAVGNTYQDGLEVGLLTGKQNAYKEIVEEINILLKDTIDAITNNQSSPSLLEYLDGCKNTLDKLKEKFDKTETDNGNDE